MAEYIEREAACSAMPDDYYGWRDKQLLKSVSSADVQPVRHGRWRLGGYGQISDAKTKWFDQFLQGGFLYCSVCGERSNLKTRYCPNCGAKMDGGEE